MSEKQINANIPLHFELHYNIYIVRHNKRRIYFKNIYKTDFRLKTQKEHTYTVDGLINGGAYIRMGLYPE